MIAGTMTRKTIALALGAFQSILANASPQGGLKPPNAALPDADTWKALKSR
jgi:hypothetical protein